MAEHSKLLSPSASGLWIYCTAMPQAIIDEAIPNESSPAAERGTIQHHYAELLDKGELDTKEFTAQVLAKEVDLTVDEWVQVKQAVQMFNDEFAKYPTVKYKDFYEQQVGFTDEWRTDCFGTADRTRIDLTNRILFVLDHKFGRVLVPAENNSQLRTYGLATIQKLKSLGVDIDKLVDKVVLGIAQPKVREALDVEVLELSELYEWDRDVLQPAQRAVLSGGTFVAGDHCVDKYCKRRPTCGTYRRKIMSVSDEAMDEFMSDNYDDDGNPLVNEGGIADLEPEELSTFLLNYRALSAAYDIAIRRAKELLLSGVTVPSYKPVNGLGSNNWSDEEAAEKFLGGQKIKKADRCPAKLISPSAAKTLLKATDRWTDKVEERYGELVVYTKGKPTIAHESDPRKPIEIVVESVDDEIDSILSDMGIEPDVEPALTDTADGDLDSLIADL